MVTEMWECDDGNVRMWWLLWMVRVTGSFGTSDRRSCTLYIVRTLKQCYRPIHRWAIPQRYPVLFSLILVQFFRYPGITFPSSQVMNEWAQRARMHWSHPRARIAVKYAQVTLAAGPFTAKRWGYTNGFQSMSSFCTALVSFFAFTIRLES